jgi:hypothetical protein
MRSGHGRRKHREGSEPEAARQGRPEPARTAPPSEGEDRLAQFALAVALIITVKLVKWSKRGGSMAIA